MRRDPPDIKGHHKCAVHGCDEPTSYIREGAAGYPIGYCTTHGRSAQQIFGDPPLRSVA